MNIRTILALGMTALLAFTMSAAAFTPINGGSANGYAGYLPDDLGVYVKDIASADVGAPTPAVCETFTIPVFMSVMTESLTDYQYVGPGDIEKWSQDPAIVESIGPPSHPEAIAGYSVAVTVGDLNDGNDTVWIMVFDGDGCYQGGVTGGSAAWIMAYPVPATAEIPAK